MTRKGPSDTAAGAPASPAPLRVELSVRTLSPSRRTPSTRRCPGPGARRRRRPRRRPPRRARRARARSRPPPRPRRAAAHEEQVDVLVDAGQRVALDGLGERQLLLAVEDDGEQGVVAAVAQRRGELAGRQGQVDDVLAVPVEDGGDAGGPAGGGGGGAPPP